VLSIGALSVATGVPVETIRTWERRYGFPAPVTRAGSGHRRYPLDAVEQLRLAVRGLAAGHKPSVLLRATPATLRDLVAVSDADGRRAVPAFAAGGSFVDRCLERVIRLDGEGLLSELNRGWNEAGALEFLGVGLGPLLDAIGERWSRGELEVGHEHFASEHTREFLSARWRAMSERAHGPPIVCATLSGELHVLGLHMAATALALAGARVIFLGANTPPEDIVRAVQQQDARAVALSGAAGASPRDLDRDVATLASRLPPDVPVLASGAGFKGRHPGLVHLADFREVGGWVRGLARAARRSPPEQSERRRTGKPGT
jgi:methanogenic corrinoid protein MtbC1